MVLPVIGYFRITSMVEATFALVPTLGLELVSVREGQGYCGYFPVEKFRSCHL